MPVEPPDLRVEHLLQRPALDLIVIAGRAGLQNRIEAPGLGEPGLALAGHTQGFHPQRVQVIGPSEASYLASLPRAKARARVEALCEAGVPCMVVTRDVAAPGPLVEACEARAVPLLRTGHDLAALVDSLGTALAADLSPSSSVHGVLVDVFGVGVLLLGKSGIGKSEVALDLVLRGHRLVADDVVEVHRHPGSTLVGQGPDLLKYHMEIRGLGIINIKDLFGIAAIRDHKRIELAVELVEWDAEEDYDRVGVDDLVYVLLGVEVARVRLPVRPGRSISSLIEVAARNQLLKARGYHSARIFQQRLDAALSEAQRRLAGGEVE